VNASRSQAADEQAALRRVATLAACGARPEEVFAAVAAEAGKLLSADATGVFRYDLDGMTSCVGAWASASVAPPFTVGAGFRLGGHNTLTLISQTGRSARVEQAEPASGDITRVGRQLGFGPVAGAPITVDGRLWGALVAMSGDGKTLPRTTEGRLARFTELAAITIASTQAGMALSSFADEQAALRRVAMLAARGAPPEEVFLAVSAEAQRLLSADITCIARFEPDGLSTSVGGWTPTGPSPIDWSVRLGGKNIQTLVYQTGQPARLDSMDDASGEAAVIARRHGFRSVVGAPISVEGRLWGVMIVISLSPEPWPPDTEARLDGFTGLAAITIADAQARTQLRDFAAEQAALRRMATLVARGAPPADVFTAVAEEAGRLLQADYTIMTRYDPEGQSTVMGSWAAVGGPGHPLPPGHRLNLEGRNLQTLVLRTRQPARLGDYSTVTGEIGTITQEWGVRSSVGAPVWVEGQLWGVISALSASKPLPPGTEGRLAEFTELAATALANAEAQAALTASRARMVAAADQARRRVERDLHDGAQQRLVSLALRLRAEQAALPPEAGEVAERLDAAVKAAVGLQEELREISHGLYPAVLTESGLRPALRGLARRSKVPVSVNVQVRERLAEPVEAAAYYAVSEALGNVARHAGASQVVVEATATDGVLRVVVRDDGCGGADFSGGSGLTEVRDRVEAFGGRVSLASPRGAGTTLEITLPL